MSQETGTLKSRVRVLQVLEAQGTGLYEVERKELNHNGVVGVFLHLSHESSLPVSSTTVTGCGGDPTVNVTVKETLWWNDSLLGCF